MTEENKNGEKVSTTGVYAHRSLEDDQAGELQQYRYCTKMDQRREGRG